MGQHQRCGAIPGRFSVQSPWKCCLDNRPGHDLATKSLRCVVPVSFRAYFRYTGSKTARTWRRAVLENSLLACARRAIVCNPTFFFPLAVLRSGSSTGVLVHTRCVQRCFFRLIGFQVFHVEKFAKLPTDDHPTGIPWRITDKHG